MMQLGSIVTGKGNGNAYRISATYRHYPVSRRFSSLSQNKLHAVATADSENLAEADRRLEEIVPTVGSLDILPRDRPLVIPPNRLLAQEPPPPAIFTLSPRARGLSLQEQLQSPFNVEAGDAPLLQRNRNDPYWQRIPIWRGVSEKQFHEKKWQVSHSSSPQSASESKDNKLLSDIFVLLDSKRGAR